jgi:hypothetical protein
LGVVVGLQMNVTDLIAAPWIRPEDMAIHFQVINATIHLPWAFEPLVHWIFSGLNWIMGY